MPRIFFSALASLIILSASLAAQSLPFEQLREALPGDITARLGIGDFDGDGDRDILVPGAGVWRNNGDARFDRHPTPSPAFAGAAPSLAAEFGMGDFDVDGDTDVVFVEWGTVRYWRSQGGVFTNAAALAPMASLPPGSTCGVVWRVAAAGDLTGDGIPDVFLAGHRDCGSCTNWCPFPPRLWRGSASGTFTDASNLTASLNLAAAFADLRDWDGDGDNDILVVQNSSIAGTIPSNRKLLLRNTGNGTLLGSAAGLSPQSAWTPVGGDLNGDGLPDLYLPVDSGPSLAVAGEVYLNAGGGNFVLEATIAWPSQSFDSALLDLDGDGVPELLRYVDRKIEIHLRTPGAGFGPTVRTVQLVAGGGFGSTFTTADLDGDGDLDLVAQSSTGSSAFLNDRSGGLLPLDGTWPRRLATNFAAFGDVDLDGDADAVVATDTGCRVVANDGTGVFSEAPCAGSCALWPVSIHLLDADGDGDPDVVRSPSSGTDAWYFQNLGSAFLQGAPIPGAAYFHLARSGDLDGDGDRDLVLARNPSSFLPPGPFIHFNLGGGTFSGATSLAGVSYPADALHLLDVDGDADLDVVASAGPAGPAYFLRNGGTGAFLAQPLPASGTVAAAGDLDGDGDPDLVIGLQVLLNSGAGVFTPFGVLPLPGPPDLGTVLFADGDALPDLVLQESQTLRISLLRGLGSGAFAPPQPITTGTGAFRILQEARDLDADGDQDLIVSGPRIFTNTTRQIARKDLPRLGRHGTMLLFGAPFEPWRLGCSLVRTNYPAPPYGTFFLDFATLVEAASGTTGPDGRAAVTFSVGTDPALGGVTYFWQAAFAVGQRFSNLEVTTIVAP